MLRTIPLSAGLLLALTATTLAQDARPKHMAARVELHQIATLTLTDQQFLAGDANAKPAQVSAHFRIAQGTGRLPVVILMHGSGGMGPNVEMWGTELNALGISTFAIDGFTGRGITGTNTNQALLGRLNFTLDMYRALDILAKHPRVDPARIALMGFSRGGQGVLYASLTRFHTAWNKSGVELAAYIPFYPDCSTTYEQDTAIADRPIRIFHGAPDDYNPVASCKPFVERLKAAGRDVVLTEYPNAQHGFDNPLAAGPKIVAKDNQTVRNCNLREQAGGVIINTSTGQPFSYGDGCVERNPHVGHDPEATAAAKTAVKSFLRGVFKLE